MSIDSLWGEEFNLPEEKQKTKKVLDKIAKPKDIKVSVEKQIKSKKLTLEERLSLIKENVLKTLEKQKDNILVIKDKETFHEYISNAITVGRIDIDTETNNSLDPITCKLMGPCIYSPGQKQAYIPINHRNHVTQERLEWQLTESDVATEFKRLLDANTFIIMHNGKFDYQVIKCTCGLELPIMWDTMIGAKLLNENEQSAGLKQQYIDKIDPEQEKYSIDHLFEDVEYADVDPEIFAYYAATDALMTDKLYEYQRKQFENPDLSRVFTLFQTIEMPLVKVIAEMELAGMEVDQTYAVRLSEKYHKKLDELDTKLNNELLKLKPTIDAWKLTPEANEKPNVLPNRTTQVSYNGKEYIYHPKKKEKRTEKPDYWEEATTHASPDALTVGELYTLVRTQSKSKVEQFTDPINLASPIQLAILFYDVLKAPVVNKTKPRSTGEEDIKAIYDKTKLEICNMLLERRAVVKLLTTYIDPIPELAKRWPDGRVRTHFNQYGAATGRLSSSEPLNFQNIPSHEKSIRMLFKAKKGYKLDGADYSAQEPRLCAFYSQDDNMIKAYNEGKDLYSVIASMSFDRSYEDCLEFYPEGTIIELDGQKVTCGYKTHQNKEGKTYRTMAKSILLGIMYGRGAASVGEQINKTRDEAQEIIDKFFKAFPKVKKWIDTTMSDAHEKGYVEDVAGRRRRLPDILLPKFDIKYKNPEQIINGNFNPFIGCKDRVDLTADKQLKKYYEMCEKARSRKEIENIQAKALQEGIEVHENGGFISQAERQAVNSRVQGGAATLTKCALISIFNDERLKNLGAYLVNTVHDEILIEVPEENAEIAGKYLSEDMINSAKLLVTNVPMKSDGYSVSHWYEDEYSVLLQNEFKKLSENNNESSTKSVEEIIIMNHPELTSQEVLNGIHSEAIFA